MLDDLTRQRLIVVAAVGYLGLVVIVTWQAALLVGLPAAATRVLMTRRQRPVAAGP